MQKLVLDSSVFVKIFIEEEDSIKAIHFMDTLIDNEVSIIVPRLFYYEVLGITKKRRLDYHVVLDILENYEHSILRYIDEAQLHTKKSLEITEQGNVKAGFPSFYDSSYHALAILHNCDFITADKRHYEKTKQLGHIQLLSEMK